MTFEINIHIFQTHRRSAPRPTIRTRHIDKGLDTLRQTLGPTTIPHRTLQTFIPLLPKPCIYTRRPKDAQLQACVLHNRAQAVTAIDARIQQDQEPSCQLLPAPLHRCGGIDDVDDEATAAICDDAGDAIICIGGCVAEATHKKIFEV